jgi:hypothetical protein
MESTIVETAVAWNVAARVTGPAGIAHEERA